MSISTISHAAEAPVAASVPGVEEPIDATVQVGSTGSDVLAIAVAADGERAHDVFDEGETVPDDLAPDRNSPGARSPALEGSVRSAAGANEIPHHSTNPADVAAMLEYVISWPEVKEAMRLLDDVPSLRPSGYGFLPSQKFGILLASLITPKHDLKNAHIYVQTNPEVRAVLRFAPMAAGVRVGSVMKGSHSVIRDPDFPSRQTIVKFTDKWLPVRADWLIPLLWEIQARIAFHTMLKHDLNTFRFTLDTAPCYSGLRRQGKTRTDDTADKCAHGTPYFGRPYAAITNGDGGLVLFGRPVPKASDSEIARDLLIPMLHELSEEFKTYAAKHGIPDHPGFLHAAIFGDTHFNDIETVGVTYQYGFEPGYSSKEAGKPRMIIGQRLLTIRNGKGMKQLIDIDNRGDLYCICGSNKPLAERRAMRLVQNRHGYDFTAHCEHCHRKTISYRVTRRGPDEVLANGHRKTGSPSTTIRALRHGDRRAAAVSHYSRQLHERHHSGLRHFGLLAKERSSQRKHITGQFKHDLWYALGGIILNLVISHNFDEQRVSREELDWDDLYVNAVRNSSQALSRKEKRRQRKQDQDASAAERAAREQRKRNRRRKPPAAQAAA